ncbi:hypothetical protein [Goodfellowiella coeruleoviolacea]|uniref:hypothetical protein n=1 Tax=Goodfellowiella coeruleoviolacea TaxID=334858 RepID=UPI0020A5AAF2|nr:hypothetical protein [Goodfellowiella coeruleoviolacea]
MIGAGRLGFRLSARFGAGRLGFRLSAWFGAGRLGFRLSAWFGAARLILGHGPSSSTINSSDHPAPPAHPVGRGQVGILLDRHRAGHRFHRSQRADLLVGALHLVGHEPGRDKGHPLARVGVVGQLVATTSGVRSVGPSSKVSATTLASASTRGGGSAGALAGAAGLELLHVDQSASSA